MLHFDPTAFKSIIKGTLMKRVLVAALLSTLAFSSISCRKRLNNEQAETQSVTDSRLTLKLIETKNRASTNFCFANCKMMKLSKKAA